MLCSGSHEERVNLGEGSAGQGISGNSLMLSASTAAVMSAYALGLSRIAPASQKSTEMLDIDGYGRDDFDGTMLAKGSSSGSDTPRDPLDGNVRILASGGDRKAVRAALRSILNSTTDEGGKTRAQLILRKLEDADVPTNVSLDPTKLYSSVRDHRNAEGKVVSVDLIVGVKGLSPGPNRFPDGSIARLDTELSHELAHVYGYVYEKGIAMSETRAMAVENQFRHYMKYEYSAPCEGRGYCD